MGLEKEKAESSVLMDEETFTRSIEPFLLKKEKLYAAPPDRDPHNINTHLKVDFEDVIAEPSSTHSFDRVWIGSHATFELIKYVFYRLLTALLAVPMAFVAGIVFGLLSCIHIWAVMPLVQSFMMALPSLRVVWSSLNDMLLGPLFYSVGRCLSSINIKTMQN